MITVYKYPLVVTDEQTIEAPDDVQWLSVASQGPLLFVWALVDTERPKVQHRFVIVGTGNPADHVVGLRHLGQVHPAQPCSLVNVFVGEPGEEASLT